MTTRREFLTMLALTPLGVRLPAVQPASVSRVEIRAEKHCLSAESALGYQHILGCDAVACEARNTQDSNPSLIILPGARTLSLEYASELRERMSGGTWVILESGLSFAGRTESGDQADVYKKAFGLRLLPLIKTTHHTAGLPYIEYVRPLSSLVRTFEAIAPVVSEPSDVIARFGEHIVCARKIFGRGGLIYLGSMLGPGLFAEEREAQAVAAELLSLVWRPLMTTERRAWS
jgi:hypothetical protein